MSTPVNPLASRLSHLRRQLTILDNCDSHMYRHEKDEREAVEKEIQEIEERIQNESN